MWSKGQHDIISYETFFPIQKLLVASLLVAANMSMATNSALNSIKMGRSIAFVRAIRNQARKSVFVTPNSKSVPLVGLGELPLKEYKTGTHERFSATRFTSQTQINSTTEEKSSEKETPEVIVPAKFKPYPFQVSRMAFRISTFLSE